MCKAWCSWPLREAMSQIVLLPSPAKWPGALRSVRPHLYEFRSEEDRTKWGVVSSIIRKTLPTDPNQPGLNALTRKVGSVTEEKKPSGKMPVKEVHHAS